MRSTFDPLDMWAQRPPPWYRNGPHPEAYHQARTDWVQTGRAVCGADISRPGYVSDYVQPKGYHARVCVKCARIAAEGKGT